MVSPFVTGERDVPLSQWTVDGNAGHVCPPVLPFLLAQNLSSKWIVPTDNMRPNFDDDYSRHL